MSKSTTQHTPGPWHHDTYDDGSSAIVPAEGYTVCVMARHNPQVEANARLIAAAPSLLRHLQWAVDRIEVANCEGDPILSAWLPDAKAAITEAGGVA